MNKCILVDFVGCYMDQEPRTLNEKMTVSTTMTVDSCRKTCTDLKFKYYGVEYSAQCFCGNQPLNVRKMREGDCLKPCAGDRTQACGGSWRIAVYENPQNIPKFLGCYMDQEARTLNEKMTSSTAMTVDSCRKTCTDLKFKYYGVEMSLVYLRWSSQCFCGNQLLNVRKMREGDCLTPCAGDKIQACGGNWRIAVYENPQYIPTAIVRKEFVGCYMDQQARTLNEKMTSSTTMTVDSCRKTCMDLKFKYYGVEWSSQCFCGNQLLNVRKMREGDCLKPCAGDRTQACGGNYRIAVYENPQYIPTAIVRKEFVGCYMDQQARTLNEKMASSTTMTVDSCRKTCTDLKFKYYGVEWSSQCFCGNQLLNVRKMREGDCLKPCAGDRTQACGGNYRIAVYENPQYIPTAIVRKEFVGCYIDQKARILGEKMTSHTAMTVNSCRKTCSDLNFKYYGVEYISQCFCGYDLIHAIKVSEEDCLTPCAGDRTQACGGSWRIAVYENPRYIPQFVGCFVDQEARTLNGKMTSSRTMTVDTCRKTCTDLKFMFYGVEV
uniref:WSC domain-containing protein n=1 Tax=Magallana gigas TaxID=29159 RepID=A0A8W8I6X5_MAGGI